MNNFPNCSFASDYDGELSELRRWIEHRLNWLDTAAARLPGACD
jgi:hypothetical protein